MQILLTIIAFIVIFSLLILIHEAGHFFAAKRAGVKVEEFGFGLPPRMFGVKRGETIYSFNWIPFGGFVRMLGEDTTTKESASSKRSFSNQPLRTQAWIVLAGICMNLLLAYVLLTVGFWIGIEPLVSTEEDFYETIYDGTANIEPGIVVVESNQPYNTVVYNGEDLDIRSFEPGDRILTDGEGQPLETVEQWQAMVDAVLAGGEAPLVQMDRADGSGGAEYLTAELLEQTEFALFYLPRLVYKADETSLWGETWQDGDTLIAIDEQQILTEADLYSVLDGKSQVTVELYRPGVGEIASLLQLPASYPLVTYIETGSPAELGGLQVGDQITALNDIATPSAQLVTQVTQEATGSLDYHVQRGEEALIITLTPRSEDGRVGIALSDLLPSYGNLSLYQSYVPSTMMGFDKLQYTWTAPVVAFKEMGHLSKVTAVMFVDVLKQFVSGQGVPEGVSGPVGIAQMTFVTIQDGFAALLRFVALLSLSLGVINVLPIPALDGGKFFFIAVQAITGRKMNSKYEHLIHAAGFFFLIVLILYVTFNDVMNLF
jgi:regulator of sigma E protease